VPMRATYMCYEYCMTPMPKEQVPPGTCVGVESHARKRTSYPPSCKSLVYCLSYKAFGCTLSYPMFLYPRCLYCRLSALRSSDRDDILDREWVAVFATLRVLTHRSFELSFSALPAQYNPGNLFTALVPYLKTARRNPMR